MFIGAWAEVRSLYIDQIKGLENLNEQVREGLDQLRSESEHLQRLDDTIRRQRETLEETFMEFEGKYTLFQEKGEQKPSRKNPNLIHDTSTRGPFGSY